MLPLTLLSPINTIIKISYSIIITIATSTPAPTTIPILHRSLITLVERSSRLMLLVRSLFGLREQELEMLSAHHMQLRAVGQRIVEHFKCFEPV